MHSKLYKTLFLHSIASTNINIQTTHNLQSLQESLWKSAFKSSKWKLLKSLYIGKTDFNSAVKNHLPTEKSPQFYLWPNKNLSYMTLQCK